MHDSANEISQSGAGTPEIGMDTSSHARFFEYYAAESASQEALNRLRHVRDIVLTIAKQVDSPITMDVVDVGCGAGTSSMLWAEAGHRVTGIDVNQPLIELARERAGNISADVRFDVGTATDLPLQEASVDVCMAAELLEHVEAWETAVQEFVRVLKPGGLLWMSTTNALCPRQAEFELPLFSWYPASVKRRCIRSASTTRPELANYATYPAYNWFTPYGLKRHLDRLGLDTMDRFDIAYRYKTDFRHKAVLTLVRSLPPLRLLAHMFTPGTTVLARKRP